MRISDWSSDVCSSDLLRDFSTRLSAADRFLHLREKARRFRAFLAGFGLAERLEQFLLARVQPGRRFDLDPHHEIAAAAPLEHRHARAAMADLAARLAARRSEAHNSELESLMT